VNENPVKLFLPDRASGGSITGGKTKIRARKIYTKLWQYSLIQSIIRVYRHPSGLFESRYAQDFQTGNIKNAAA